MSSPSPATSLCSQISILWRQAAYSLSQFGFPNYPVAASTQTMPGGESSIDAFSQRLLAALSAIEPLTEAKDVTLLPSTWLPSLNEALENLRGAVDNLRRFLTETDPARIASYNSSLLQVTLTDGSAFNIGELLANVAKVLDSVLEQAARIRAVLSPSDYLPTTGALKTLAQIVTKSQLDARQIEVLLSTSKKTSESAQGNFTAIGNTAKGAEDLLRSMENSKQAYETSKSQADLALGRIGAVDNQAGDLKAKVVAYEVDFQKFQDGLNSKQSAYDGIMANVDQLFKDLTSEKSAVSKLTTDANAMLTGATKAGLSQTYKELLDQLTPEVNRASESFRGAVIWLFWSSIPLALYLFLTALSPLLGDSFEILRDIPFSFTRMIAFALLLIPAVWYAKFAAAKHHALFRLREEYAHRYALCMAVDGFQRQAPDYKFEIAGATFLEMTRNPIKLMDTKALDVEHPNVVQKFLMDKLGLNFKGQPDEP